MTRGIKGGGGERSVAVEDEVVGESVQSGLTARREERCGRRRRDEDRRTCCIWLTNPSSSLESSRASSRRSIACSTATPKRCKTINAKCGEETERRRRRPALHAQPRLHQLEHDHSRSLHFAATNPLHHLLPALRLFDLLPVFLGERKEDGPPVVIRDRSGVEELVGEVVDREKGGEDVETTLLEAVRSRR